MLENEKGISSVSQRTAYLKNENSKKEVKNTGHSKGRTESSTYWEGLDTEKIH